MDRRRSQRLKSMKSIYYGSVSKSESKSHDHAKKNMNSNSKSCKVISNLLLPEDLIFDILILVPLNYLINSARYVCKAWATTIRSSNFVEAYERCAHSKPGIYVENCTLESSSYFLEFKDDVNDQFERTDLGTPQRMGCLFGTCDGILLLSNGPNQTFIVNPVLKCWLRIPPLPNSQELIGNNNQLMIVCVPRTTKFKLFFKDVLKVSGALWSVFYVLSIGTDNSWKEIARKEFFVQRRCYQELHYNGGNDLYWRTKDKVFVMDVDKETIVREYPLPSFPMYDSPIAIAICLWMKNRLSCIVRKERHHAIYQIHTLECDSGKWFLCHEMDLDFLASFFHNEVTIQSLKFCFWINDQTIIHVAQRPIGNMESLENMYFGYNVKTKQLTKIGDTDIGNFKVWSHINSLVSLPSTPT